jgi:hypothetical protein
MRLLTPASYAGCRWGEAGSFPCESQHGRIATPNLDQFFGEEGLSFTNAYAGYTVCGPSRTTFFTGRHSGNFLKHGYDGNHLGPGQANTTAQMLQDAGYTTAGRQVRAAYEPRRPRIRHVYRPSGPGRLSQHVPYLHRQQLWPQPCGQSYWQLAKQVQGTVHGRPCIVQLHDRCLPEPRSAVA